MEPFCRRHFGPDTKGLEITYIESVSSNKSSVDRAFDVLFEATLLDWNELNGVDSTKHIESGYTIK
jgi:hypothetical protein